MGFGLGDMFAHFPITSPKHIKPYRILLELRLTEHWTSYTADRGDVDTYFVMYRWSKT